MRRIGKWLAAAVVALALLLPLATVASADQGPQGTRGNGIALPTWISPGDPGTGGP